MNRPNSHIRFNKAAPVQLSPSGDRRRAAMLDELDNAMQQQHRRRKFANRACLASLIILPMVAAGVLINRNLNNHSTQLPVDRLVVESQAEQIAGPQNVLESTVKPFTITRVASHQPLRHTEIVTASHSPTVDAWMDTRLASDLNIEFISDDELLDTLNAMNRPTGLIRTVEKTWLTRPVTDAELGLKKKQGILPSKFWSSAWC